MSNSTDHYSYGKAPGQGDEFFCGIGDVNRPSNNSRQYGSQSPGEGEDGCAGFGRNNLMEEGTDFIQRKLGTYSHGHNSSGRGGPAESGDGGGPDPRLKAVL